MNLLYEAANYYLGEEDIYNDLDYILEFMKDTTPPNI